MPGRVRKYIKKQLGRARSYAKKRYGTKGGMVRLVKDVYKLKRLVNTERKNIDVIATSSPTSGNEVVAHLSAVAIGDGPSQRSGRSLRFLTLQLRAYVELDPAVTTGTTSVYRVIIFNDKEPQRGTPAAADLLSGSAARSLRNWEQQQEKRFNILMDKFLTVNPQTLSRTIEFYRKISLHTRYNGDLASDVSNNKLYIMIMSDNTGAAANSAINWQTRLTYVDN